MKYRNHPSILKIGEVYRGSNTINFSFSTVQRTRVWKEITQLNSSKAGRSTDIPTKITNQIQIFLLTVSLQVSINLLQIPFFRLALKTQMLPRFLKMIETYRIITDQLVHYQMEQKFLNNVCFNKFQNL